MAARTNTLPDALALVMMNNGFTHFCQPHVASQLWNHYDHASFEDVVAGRPVITLRDSGKELLAASPLWAAHQRLLSMGYRRDKGKATKRYAPYVGWDEANDRPTSAWISASARKPAIFISRPVKDGGPYRLED